MLFRSPNAKHAPEQAAVSAFVSVTQEDASAPGRPAKSNGDLVTFLQMIAFGVVGFGIIVLTARSIFAALNKQAVGLTMAGPTGEIANGGVAAIGSSPSGALGIGHSPSVGPNAVDDDDDVVTMSNIQGQMRASAIRKVTQLVDRHPDTTLGIIRGWIATDHG